VTSPPGGRPSPERLTRNLGELLQELRVVQTGVQILTGFLLTVPFSSRFDDLTDMQRTTYLVVLCGAVLTTAFVVAPVAFHRVLFRQRRRYWLVEASATSARIGLALLALTSAGVLFLVFDVVVGLTPAIVVLSAALVCFGALWAVVPLMAGGADDSEEGEDVEQGET
jgi:hypothetical protein